MHQPRRNWLASLTFLVGWLLSDTSGSLMADLPTHSNLKSDERIVFITTDAWLSEDGTTWTVPIHAWVHEYENNSLRLAVVAGALRSRYGLQTAPDTLANFQHRLRLITADNERDKQIVLQIAGEHVTLPETAKNGHTIGQFKLDASVVARHASDRQLTYTAVLPQGDRRSFSGTVNLISRQGISVISDFDDTVKITHADDRAKMLDYALFRDFQAVPGMAELYSSWARRGAAIHFVSSSPWHLYEPMEEFLDASGFPERSMSLKEFRFKDETLMNLFLKGTETKPAQIEPILRTFPDRRFILVGDSGQEDPEVYAPMLRDFPDRIQRVYIRNVTGASRADQRYEELFRGIDPQKWMLFDDPAELHLPNP